jgi:hypothetical protein
MTNCHENTGHTASWRGSSMSARIMTRPTQRHFHDLWVPQGGMTNCSENSGASFVRERLRKFSWVREPPEWRHVG